MRLIWFPEEFLNLMTPLSATLFLCMPILFCYFTLCIILMLFNMYTHSNLGLSILSIMLVANYMFVQADLPFYPLHFACGAYFYTPEQFTNNTVDMYVFYFIVNSILYIVMSRYLKRMDFIAEK